MGILVAEQATPATPATAYSHLYPKSDGLWYFKDDAGVEHQLVTPAPTPRGHIYGLQTNNNVTDAVNDIDVAAGFCRANDNTVDIVLSSAITKRLDAAWAVGTNQGGLDTGSKTASKVYAVWLIRRSDTGVVDVLFSLSMSAPTMPTNYDSKVLIGAVTTNGSNTIFPYRQVGDWFYYAAYQWMLSAGTAATETSFSTAAWIPTAALRMQCAYYCDFSYPNSINSGVLLFLYVVSGQNIQALYRLTTGNTGTDYNTGSIVLPVTGYVAYHRTLQGSASGGNTYVGAQGFELPRGRV